MLTGNRSDGGRVVFFQPPNVPDEVRVVDRRRDVEVVVAVIGHPAASLLPLADTAGEKRLGYSSRRPTE